MGFRDALPGDGNRAHDRHSPTPRLEAGPDPTVQYPTVRLPHFSRGGRWSSTGFATATAYYAQPHTPEADDWGDPQTLPEAELPPEAVPEAHQPYTDYPRRASTAQHSPQPDYPTGTHLGRDGQPRWPGDVPGTVHR
jgi:hypothetical protein